MSLSSDVVGALRAAVVGPAKLAAAILGVVLRAAVVAAPAVLGAGLGIALLHVAAGFAGAPGPEAWAAANLARAGVITIGSIAIVLNAWPEVEL